MRAEPQNAVIGPRTITPRSWKTFERTQHEGRNYVVPSHLRYKYNYYETEDGPDFERDETGYGGWLADAGSMFENSLTSPNVNPRFFVLRIYTWFRLWMRRAVKRVQAKLAMQPLLL